MDKQTLWAYVQVILMIVFVGIVLFFCLLYSTSGLAQGDFCQTLGFEYTYTEGKLSCVELTSNDAIQHNYFCTDYCSNLSTMFFNCKLQNCKEIRKG